MEWLNEPEYWGGDTEKITITAESGTDMWRQPGRGGIRSNGHFYYRTVDGDFTATVKVTGVYEAQFDQAGIMVMIDDERWMKCGVEVVDGVQYASVVVTREWSDWSRIALDDPAALWLKVERKGEILFVYYSLDGENYDLMRKAYFSDALSVDVGLATACPKGKGFEAVFENFNV